MANILSEVKVRVNKESTFQPVVNTQLETDINLAGAVNKIAEWYDEITDLKTMKGAYVYKGSVDNIDALPLTNNKTGDIYNVLYEYILQEEEPEDWETNYSNYYTKDGSEYSNVEGVESPTWTTDTYYTRTDNGMNYGWTSASSSGTLSDWDALGGNIDMDEATYHDIERLFSNPYLEIGGSAPFTLESAGTWDGIVEYSTDTVEWTEWDGTEITSNEANMLYLRGTDNTVITGVDSSPFTFTTEGKIFIYGKLDVLLDYQKAMRNIEPTMGMYAFYDMFNGAPLMTAPELPMTALTMHCYESMFEGCTDLSVTPELPATTLSNACYKNMFKGCTNLRVLPRLHAKTMYPNCYEGMFNGCTMVELSETATSECWMNYRVPAANTGVDATDALKDMFANTSGTFAGTPIINTTYYTSNTDVAKDQLTLFSGSYDDLTDKPELFSGNYNDLSNKPALKAVATSGSYNDLTDKPTLSDVATSGSYNDLTDKPSLFSGSYDDLTDKPELSTVATSGAYSDLSGTPSLSTVATSGSYNDLTNKPSLFSGNYNDLTNKPDLDNKTITKANSFQEIVSGSTATSVDVATALGKIAEWYDEIADSAGEKVDGDTYTIDGTSYTAGVGSEVFNQYGSNGNKAVGTYSHSEGYETIAKGDYSHAEGYNTTANGTGSHAEGYYTTATGTGAHASGYQTTASTMGQTVIGKYNVADTTSAVIIGNGVSGAPSNAFTMDWDGVCTFDYATINSNENIELNAVDDVTITTNKDGSTIYTTTFSGIDGSVSLAGDIILNKDKTTTNALVFKPGSTYDAAYSAYKIEADAYGVAPTYLNLYYRDSTTSSSWKDLLRISRTRFSRTFDGNVNNYHDIPCYKQLYSSTTAPSATSQSVEIYSTSILGVYDMLKIWVMVDSVNYISYTELLVPSSGVSPAYYFATPGGIRQLYLGSDGKTLSLPSITGSPENIAVHKVIGVRL